MCPRVRAGPRLWIAGEFGLCPASKRGNLLELFDERERKETVRRAVRDRIGCRKVGLVRIAQRGQKDLSHAQEEGWNRRRILHGSEKLNQRLIGSFFFEQAARESKFKHSIPQSVRGFCTLPDEARKAGFDFERSDDGDPRRTTNKDRALAKVKTLEQLRGIQSHPARARLWGK